jgi:hypothetical protein
MDHSTSDPFWMEGGLKWFVRLRGSLRARLGVLSRQGNRIGPALGGILGTTDGQSRDEHLESWLAWCHSITTDDRHPGLWASSKYLTEELTGDS